MTEIRESLDERIRRIVAEELSKLVDQAPPAPTPKKKKKSSQGHNVITRILPDTMAHTVMSVLADLDGAKVMAVELPTLMPPEVNERSVSPVLSQLYHGKLVDREKVPYSHTFTYWITDAGRDALAKCNLLKEMTGS